RTYAGPSLGEGSIYSWAGNKEIGEGRMTIIESRPYQRIAIKLEFFKPFQSTNQAEFTLKPIATGILVTWAMAGKMNFVCKIFSLFVNMDRMVGKDFESGLAQLKRESEAAVPVAAHVGR